MNNGFENIESMSLKDFISLHKDGELLKVRRIKDDDIEMVGLISQHTRIVMVCDVLRNGVSELKDEELIHWLNI